MSPLRIAFVTVADLPEGAGNTARLRSLVQALRGSGHDVRIWNEHALGVAPESALSARGTLAGAPYEYVLGTTARARGFGMLGAKLRAVSAIARRMRATRAAGALDVVWFNCLSYYDVAPLSALARGLGVATIQSYEDERLELVSQEPLGLARRCFGWNARLADRRCPRAAHALVVISHYLREKYGQLCGDPARVHLVPTLLDTKAWVLPAEVETREPVLLYSGAFGEQDDFDGLLDALDLLRRQGRAFRLVLLGGQARDGERVAALRARVDALGLTPRVEWPGFVPAVQVRERIARANLLLNLRRDGVWSRSGLSTKLSEYLASGRCVVASAVGDVGRYVRDAESALVVRPGASGAQLAPVLASALGSLELRRRIGAAGREVARQSFDLAVGQRLLEPVLRAMVSR
jgi:glycosyltransferase involved in cell wall biosynthesis